MSAELEFEPTDWVGREANPVWSQLARDLASRPAVSLERVLAAACLTTRFELKYLVPMLDLPAVLDRLPRALAALDIESRRLFAYESVYFDTEDFALYRQHLQGRRHRYKARTAGIATPATRCSRSSSRAGGARPSRSGWRTTSGTATS